jgi:hypothetical protein
MIVGGGLKDFNSAGLDDDPWVVWARQMLTDAGYDYKTSGNYGFGLAVGWQMVQALQIAGELPGGLNRTNFNLAWRAMDMTSPAMVEGVKFNMNGNADAYLVEGSDISRWNVATQSWDVETIVELSGQSALCSWSSATGSCA